jgi:hypothetical protein
MTLPIETLPLPGLPAEVENILARRDIPHIETQGAAFFAGSLHAAT